MIRAALKQMMKPVIRLIVSLIAIPLFRLFMRKVVRMQTLDAELEKDLEEWFRGSLLLLIATANMEHLFFGWVPVELLANHGWITVAFRVMLAISVVETMPDQELFSIIHPGPPKLKSKSVSGIVGELIEKKKAIFKGILCQHLNRSSPVFAIMAAIFGGVDHLNLMDHLDETTQILSQFSDPEGLQVVGGGKLAAQANSVIQNNDPQAFMIHNNEGWIVGWVCYGIAIIQYLIIGLVTSRDKALDALSEFDKQIAIRRRELIDEFALPEDKMQKRLDKEVDKTEKKKAKKEENEEKKKDSPERPE